MKYIILFLILIFNKNVSSCIQAWNGGGTGAWYRVDTSCQYSFISTSLIYCLPKIILSSNTTLINDGFFISLGIYNRYNGISADIGLTYDSKTNKWYSYENDDSGWKSGNITIDSKINNCLNISLFIIHNYIKYIIRTKNGLNILGEDIYLSSQINPLLNLTNIGFYRFDSIAQINETLKTGSQMIHAQMNNWILQLQSGLIVSAEPYYIASNVHGYPPGSCCTKEEINTIKISQQIKWNQSDISIYYI